VKKVSIALVLTSLSALSADPQFEVASIRPNLSAGDTIDLSAPVGGRFRAVNVSLRMLIMRAYKVKNFQISGGPAWMNSDRYDIAAGASETGIDEGRFKLMLQALLADRFKLIVHREMKQMPVYALLPARNGLKLPEPTGICFQHDAPPPPPMPGQPPPIPCGGFLMDGSRLEGRRISMAQLVSALSNMLGRPAVDRTGYTGAFDVHLRVCAGKHRRPRRRRIRRAQSVVGFGRLLQAHYLCGHTATTGAQTGIAEGVGGDPGYRPCGENFGKLRETLTPIHSRC
jgi:uncharacterized protein (TIGR03435 family)